MTLSNLVYAACALTSVLCMYLLMRGHRRTRQPLLLWSSICFAGLAIGNVLLLLDLAVLPNMDLSLLRTLPILVGLSCLIFYLVWEAK